MSKCPIPNEKTVDALGPAGEKIGGAPDVRNPNCNVVNSTTTTAAGPGDYTEATVYVPGPRGADGERGEKGFNGLGFTWMNTWAVGIDYTSQFEDELKLASVVNYKNETYVCALAHTSTEENHPGEIGSPWQLMVGQPVLTEESIMDKVGNVIDWVKKAKVKDWLKVGAIAAGIVWAGSKISDMMEGDPEVSADARYDGTIGTPIADGGGTGVPYTPPSIKSVIIGLCNIAGVLYNVDALVDEPCEFTIASNASVSSILDQLSLAYQFDIVSSAGILKFIPRGNTVVKNILANEIGFGDGDIAPSPYTATRFQGIDLPRMVTLGYHAQDMDYADFTQSSIYDAYTEGQNVVLNVPVTLSHAKAKLITENVLIDSHLERNNYTFTTTYEHIDLEPGDVVNVETIGDVRILSVKESSEGLLDFTVCSTGGSANTGGIVGDLVTPAPSTNIAPVIGFSQGLWIDPTVMNDGDKAVRVIGAIHGYDAVNWPGAAIYMSEDNGATYSQIGSATKQATVGIVEVVTPVASYYVWDNTTEITVKLKTGSLLSVSEIAQLNGANRCQIGQEMLSFGNATLVGPKTYKLTKLLRGLQGSEVYIDNHKADELFVLLDDAIVPIVLDDIDRNKTKKFKVVTVGSSLDLAEETDVYIVSNNTMPWACTNGKAELVGEDHVVTWMERSRFDNNLKDFNTTIRDLDYGGFGFAVIDQTTDLPIPTSLTPITGQPTFTYTKEMQIRDFGSAQTHIKVSIVQMSNKWGPGFPLIINN